MPMARFGAGFRVRAAEVHIQLRFNQSEEDTLARE